MIRSVIVTAMGFSLAACHGSSGGDLTGKLTADNAVYAYVSDSPSARGNLIGSGTAWGATYDLKKAPLTHGRTYYLHIEAINYGAQGALIGEFHLSGNRFHFANGGQTLVTGPLGWSGGFNSTNSDVAPQPWVEAKGAVASQGANGVGPWGLVAGVSPLAQWIWPTDPKSAPGGPPGACGLCTVDFTAMITPAAS
jgi:hypothetical protein